MIASRALARGLGLVAAVGLGVFTEGLARAEPEGEADQLFTAGRELLEQGRFAEACPKLERSEALAPAVGTLLNLGYCWEQVGRFRSAMDAYAEAEVLAQRSSDPKRMTFARERYTAASARVMKLVVRVADAKIAGLEIRRNDVVLPSSDYGQPIPVDPDEIVVSATAPGHTPWKGVVLVRGEKAVATVIVPPLEERSSFAGFDLLSGKRLVALGLGTAAVVSLSAGIATGLAAKGRHGDADAHCTPAGCDAIGNGIQERAAAQGEVGTGLVVLGALAAGAGIYLWLSGGDGPAKARPKTTTRAAVLGVRPGGAVLGGTF